MDDTTTDAGAKMTIPRLRFASSLALAGAAAFAFYAAMDHVFGGLLGVYPATALFPIVGWSMVSTTALMWALRLGRGNRWLALPYVALGAAAAADAVARSRSHAFVVAGAMCVHAFLLWKGSDPALPRSTRDAWVFATLGWDPTWQRRVPARVKVGWIVAVAVIGGGFITLMVIDTAYVPKAHRWILPAFLLWGFVALTAVQILFRRDVLHRLDVDEDLHAARYAPFRQVGGDFYDVVKLDETRSLIIMADVSGKGTGAALLTANLQALLLYALPREPSLEAVAAAVNSHLVRHTEPGRFVTVVLVELDLVARRVRYVNAGHNAPLGVTPDGVVLRFEATGVPLGMFETSTYSCSELEFPAGTVLAFYTDGLSERASPSGEMFGEERVLAALRDARDKPAQDLVDEIVRGADRFARGAQPADDTALLIVAGSGTGIGGSEN